MSDKDIVIIRIDKSNMTVVLLRTDYHVKIKIVLSNPICRKLTLDPANRTERSSQTVILIKKSDFPADVANRQLPHASVSARLCGLPKIHRTTIPLRPTVNYVTSPTYPLAKYLEGLLCPFFGHSTHHIINSKAFVEKLHTINLQEMDILVFFDIVSLFTEVPLEDTLKAAVRACLQSQHCSHQTGHRHHVFSL